MVRTAGRKDTVYEGAGVGVTSVTFTVIVVQDCRLFTEFRLLTIYVVLPSGVLGVTVNTDRTP